MATEGNVKVTVGERVQQLEAYLDAILAEAETPCASLHDGTHTKANLAYAQLFGFDQADVLQSVPFLDLVAPDDRDKIRAVLAQAETAHGNAPLPAMAFTARLADDSHQYIVLQVLPGSESDEQQLTIQVTRGNLPVRANDSVARRGALRHALAAQNAYGTGGDEAAGLYVCVDELGDVEQQLGMAGCDALLTEVSLFLLEELDKRDQCFRVDYSEFVVLLQRESFEALHAAGESLRQAMEGAEFSCADHAIALTVSIGMAVLPTGIDREQQILKAKSAARDSSDSGGNELVQVKADANTADVSDTDDSWARRVQHALKSDGFYLTYQSIASLSGDQREHRDVLLRMRGEQGGQILPGEFFPAARQHGLMPDIDRWVTQQAFAVAATHQARDEHPLLFVKISTATIELGKHFSDWLDSLVEETGVDSNDLLFCYSELALQSHANKAAKLAAHQKQLGFQICITDFGTTQKSLKQLDRIDADYVKLSLAFSKALIEDTADAEVTDTLRSLKQKDVKIIAAQVEDANSMAQLWKAGVHYIQGFYIEEPTTAQN